MKKILSTLVMLILISMTANAAKASGKPRAVKQPDGTTLMVRTLGDEHFSWTQTMDGVLLVKENGAFYIAQPTSTGELTSTGVLAHNLDSRKDAEVQKAKAQNKAMFFSSNTAKTMKKASGYPVSGRCPHMGDVTIPIIMVDFPDKKMTYSKDDFEEYFNGETLRPYRTETRLLGYGSVNAYFREASFGKFNPKFELYGPYTVKNNHDYYGHENAAQEKSIEAEAIKLADADINFADSKYDLDNDGNVDMVYILYAGTGANLADEKKDIWPYCAYNRSYQADNKAIHIVGVSNEQVENPFVEKVELVRAGIGVFCHEMSHGLGMPDLYGPNDINYRDNTGPEYWDLMDAAENLAYGIWPVQYTAWEREAMGWMSFEYLTEPQRVTIYPLNTADGKAYCIKNPNNSKEYYVIENYTFNKWNYRLYGYLNSYASLSEKTLPNANLVLSHIVDVNGSMHPNQLTTSKPYNTIIAADGFLMSSYNLGETITYKGESKYIDNRIFFTDMAADPYPGIDNVTEILEYKNYTGEDMGLKFPIKDIVVNDDRSISFTFISDPTTGINDINVNISNDNIYTIDGRCVGKETNSLPHGIYIKNGKKIRL